MTMFDYQEVITVAKELILEFGRTANYQILSSTAADPSKPWDGPGTPVVSVDIPAPSVFVPSSGNGLGKDLATEDLLKKVKQVALVSPVDDRIEKCHQIVDGGITYKIEWVQTLKPANEIVLFVVGVNQ